ncbi:MAG TPA: hypothetical protein VFT02_15040 [Pyrinomonadaceae bacterium]|nr:hypothetical protein [Pyrinomonadaceae bacterium]
MSKLKPMSAAEYRANAQKKEAERPTEIVPLKSGSVFELRRPDLEAYMVMGRLPQSLVRTGVKAWKIGAEQVANNLSDEDATDALIFMREIVHDCTVNPKFVEFAVNDNEIGAADMLKEDFNEIFHWAMTHQGVAGIDGLQSFRAGQTRGTVGARAHGKKQRRKSKQPLETVGSIQ